MTATNHALTGAMIATVSRQPLLALPLAFASHFVCDIIPHFDIPMKFGSRRMYTWLVLDGLVAAAAAGCLLIAGVNNPVLLTMAAFFAMSPDLAWLYYGLRGLQWRVEKYDPITRFHHKIQKRLGLPGLVIELLWGTLMVTTILYLQ